MDYLKSLLDSKKNLVFEGEDIELPFCCYLENIYKISEVKFFIENRFTSFDEYKKHCINNKIKYLTECDGKAIMEELIFFQSAKTTFYLPSYKSCYDFGPLLERDKPKRKEPVYIIIPDTVVGPINCTNIENFLKNGIYKPLDYHNSLDSLENKSMKLTYNNDSFEVVFVPDISILSSNQLRRVVCIFVENKIEFDKCSSFLDEKQLSNICKFSVQLEDDFEEIGNDVVCIKIKNKQSRYNRITIDFIKQIIEKSNNI